MQVYLEFLGKISFAKLKDIDTLSLALTKKEGIPYLNCSATERFIALYIDPVPGIKPKSTLSRCQLLLAQ